MYISENNDWIRYSSQNNWKLSTIKDCGKWMFYYKSREFAVQIITKAIDQEIVTYAKHTKSSSGIACLYASGTNIENNLQVINFMIENNLIRLTNDLNYFDTTFKFNSQSWQKEYGNPFEGTIRLSSLIDLNTGIKLDDIDLNSKLTCPPLVLVEALILINYYPQS